MKTAMWLNALILRGMLVLALVMAAVGPLAVPSQAAPADVTFTVNYNGDIHDASLDGICDGGVGDVCTLREAIEESNAATGYKTVAFDSGMAGQTIYLSYGPLTISTDNLTIDATTSGGDVIVDSGGLTANSNLFEVQGNYNTIRGLMLQGWPDARYPDSDHGHGVRIYDPTASGMASYNMLDTLRIYGFEHDGILISGDPGGGGSNNAVVNTLVGAANWASTSCSLGNLWEGIEIKNGADNNSITYSQIVCNGFSGVWLDGTSGQILNTYIQNNNIGNNGSQAMGNGASGIADFQANATMISNNIISGNANDGIWLNGSTSAVIFANMIGVNSIGDTAIPNAFTGIAMTNGATNTAVGSPTDANARNVISGNTLCGVDINSGATYNVLDGNFIGLEAAGLAAIPNGLAGVCLNGASNNTLSTFTATVNQYISGNTREGVYAVNSASVVVNPATLIGVASDGNTALGNGLDGVYLDTGTTDAQIYSGQVKNNGGAGIAVVGDSTVANLIRPMVVGNNAGLGIDLGSDGHTANDVGDGDNGPNHLMNFPEVNTMLTGGFAGYACLGCVVNFYLPIGNPTANGGGGTYLDSTSASSTTGDFAYTFPAGVTAVTMQACASTAWDCSELSPRVENSPAPAYRTFLPMVGK